MTPTSNSDSPTQPGKLEYWMGTVDTTLRQILAKLTEHKADQDAQWEALDEWRSTVEARLSHGSERFAEHERDIQRLLERVGEPSQKRSQRDESFSNAMDRFVQWPWLLDKIFVPVITTIIALTIGYIFGRLTGAIP